MIKIAIGALSLTFWCGLILPSLTAAQDENVFDCEKAFLPILEECSGPTMGITSAGSGLLGVPDNWESTLSRAACYRAIIDNIDIGLSTVGDGEARIALDVEEVLWGPNLDELAIWVPGVDIPGCLLYGKQLKFEQLDYIGPGSEVLVQCWQNEGCWESSKWGVFIVGGDTPVSLQESDLGTLRALSVRNSLVDQTEKSSLVCVADFLGIVDGLRSSFLVKKVIRGNSELCEKEILVYWANFYPIMKKRSKDTAGIYLFLREAVGDEKFDKNWVNTTSYEGVADSLSQLLPQFSPVERYGSVLWPQVVGYQTFHGFSAQLPEELHESD